MRNHLNLRRIKSKREEKKKTFVGARHDCYKETMVDNAIKAMRELSGSRIFLNDIYPLVWFDFLKF